MGAEPIEIGRFRVIATRRSATCGPQSNVYLPRAEFDVSLHLTGQGGFSWTPAGSAPARGLWHAPARTFRVFQEEDIVAWAPDRRRDIVGCTLRRSDVIEGVIEMDTATSDGGTPDGGTTRARSFTALETITYGVAAGDCRAILGAAKGQYAQLPCEVTYAFEAVRR